MTAIEGPTLVASINRPYQLTGLIPAKPAVWGTGFGRVAIPYPDPYPPIPYPLPVRVRHTLDNPYILSTGGHVWSLVPSPEYVA